MNFAKDIRQHLIVPLQTYYRHGQYLLMVKQKRRPKSPF